jgi:cysteine-rich repeat protein
MPDSTVPNHHPGAGVHQNLDRQLCVRFWWSIRFISFVGCVPGPFTLTTELSDSHSIPPPHIQVGDSSGNQTTLPYPCTVYSDSPWHVGIDWACVENNWEVTSGTIACGDRTFQVDTDHCQNGIVGDDTIITETCDDGNNVAGQIDGCAPWCETWPGWVCSGQPSTCSQLPCGDGVKGPGEACDDGNAATGDGCSNLCTVEPTYSCVGSPSVCASACSNGVVNGPVEQCDDGGRAGGDGCSSLCQLEPETKSGNAGLFFPISTDENNDGLATASDPVETKVWPGNGFPGLVTITESGSPAAPTGYSVLGVNVSITAPVATVAAPLILQFVYGRDPVPGGAERERHRHQAQWRDRAQLHRRRCHAGSVRRKPPPTDAEQRRADPRAHLAGERLGRERAGV